MLAKILSYNSNIEVGPNGTSVSTIVKYWKQIDEYTCFYESTYAREFVYSISQV